MGKEGLIGSRAEGMCSSVPYSCHFLVWWEEGGGGAGGVDLTKSFHSLECRVPICKTCARYATHEEVTRLRRSSQDCPWPRIWHTQQSCTASLLLWVKAMFTQMGSPQSTGRCRGCVCSASNDPSGTSIPKVLWELVQLRWSFSGPELHT